MIRAASLGALNTAEVREADATQLPFDDERFDGVVIFIVLHHVIDWEGALAEIARVLCSTSPDSGLAAHSAYRPR